MKNPQPEYINRINYVIGQHIRKRRLMLNLTQTALGAKVGVSFQQIQKYESSKHSIPLARLLLLATALDRTIEQLLPTPERCRAIKDSSPCPR